MLRLIEVIGFSVCHQIPQRSLAYGNFVLPICARDTGIYVGFVVSLLFLTVINRRHQRGFPPWYVISFGVLGILLMAVDGISSYGGFRETTNSIRLITGLLTGSALPLGLLPIFNYQAWKNASEEKIIRNPAQFLMFISVLILTYFVLQLRPGFLFYPIAFLVAVAVVFVFVFINIILVTVIPIWTQKAEGLRDLAIPIVIALVLAVFELAVSYALHGFLLAQVTS